MGADGKHGFDAHRARARIEPLAALPGALLPVLNALQAEFGYVDDSAVPLIAQTLNLSAAEVYGALGFYHDFRRQAPGRHILRLCRAEACQAMGCEKVIGQVETHLGAKLGQTTADREFTLEPVYCLGNCALSPALMLDGELHGRVSADSATRLLERTRGAV